MHFRFLFPLLVLLLTLSSCIEGDEELWLNRDGSGRIEATYRMPPAIMSRFGGAASLQDRLTTAVANEPDIRIEHISHRIEGAQVVFDLRADFDDVRSFIELPQKHFRDPANPEAPSNLESFFGTMKLKLNGFSLKFDRNIDLSPILPKSVQENATMLGKSSFRYTIHLPAKPSNHNASSVGEDGSTLQWDFLLREHTTSPMNIHCSMLLPLPWWLWTTLVLVALLILYGVTRLLRKSRRSRLGS